MLGGMGWTIGAEKHLEIERSGRGYSCQRTLYEGASAQRGLKESVRILVERHRGRRVRKAQDSGAQRVAVRQPVSKTARILAGGRETEGQGAETERVFRGT